MGSNPTALSIQQNADSSYMMICHNCGANGVDVFRALGLQLDELFGEHNKKYERPVISRKLQAELKEDRIFIAIYDAGKERGESILYSDHQRYRLSTNRIAGIERLQNRN